MINLQSIAQRLAFGHPVDYRQSYSIERTAPCNCCWQPVRAHKLNAEKVCPECVAKGAVKCKDCGEYFLPHLLDEDGVCMICAADHEGERFCTVCRKWQPYFDGWQCEHCNAEDFEYSAFCAAAGK